MKVHIYNKYDTLDKLEKYFDQHPDIVKSGEYRVVRENKYNNTNLNVSFRKKEFLDKELFLK